MYHNYFYLRQLAPAINEKISGLQFLSCFSQNKDEIVLGFANQHTQCFILANFASQIGLLEIKSDFSRAKKNSVDLFQALIGLKVKQVGVFQNERSFFIDFSHDYRMIFKMHGSRCNLISSKKNKILDIFRHNLPNDLNLDVAGLDVNTDLSFDKFESCQGDLLTFNPTLGKEVRGMLNDEGYQSASIDTKWKLYNSIINVLTSNNPLVYKDQSEKPFLLLWHVEDEKIFDSTNIIDTNNHFFRAVTHYHYVSKLQIQLLNQIDRDIKKTQNYLSKSQSKLEDLIGRRSYEEVANILMANLYNIPKRAKTTTLHDLYNENNEIEIKLNPALTIQKNAENYYRKSKNQKKESDKLNENILARMVELDNLDLKRSLIEEAEDFKSLKSLDKNIATKKASIENLPYKKVTFEGFDILIGKNAKSNDQLTLKIANKEDLFLHAKDVSGSHVIIKQIAGKNYPKSVIEYAAALAAGHSKRKNDSLCPVLYTPKKFVRKRKGDPAGAVVIERESVILVKPIRS
jgi:predicted ribosome quality control (RQC) complex YloA/Tae2 family protein